MRQFAVHKIPRPILTFDQASIRNPTDLEIGAGQGLHAIRYSQAHPERVLLAVEKTHSRFARLQRRQQKHPHLTNLYPIHADAVSFVTHYLADESLERIFLLYPNPYPKAKQANLRWHRRPFMATLLKKLKLGGQLTLATNEASYVMEAARDLTELWRLELLEYSELDERSSPRTHFERKYLERGEKCWNLRLCKSSSLAVQ